MSLILALCAHEILKVKTNRLDRSGDSKHLVSILTNRSVSGDLVFNSMNLAILSKPCEVLEVDVLEVDILIGLHF